MFWVADDRVQCVLRFVNLQAVTRFAAFVGDASMARGGAGGSVAATLKRFVQLSVRHDEHPDVDGDGAGDRAGDALGGTGRAHASQARFAPGATVTYWVGAAPGYLARAAVQRELMLAFSTWGVVLPVRAGRAGLRFERVEARAHADVVIRWASHSEDNQFFFDGPGGALARTVEADYDGDGRTQVHLTFDAAERWALTQNVSGQGKVPPGSFALLPVAIHEIGHVLGLAHSDDAHAAMSPFYIPGRIGLAASDVARVQAMY